MIPAALDRLEYQAVVDLISGPHVVSVELREDTRPKTIKRSHILGGAVEIYSLRFKQVPPLHHLQSTRLFDDPPDVFFVV